MRRLRAPAPPLGPGLWLTLASLPAALLNLRYLAETWPHTPELTGSASPLPNLDNMGGPVVLW